MKNVHSCRLYEGCWNNIHLMYFLAVRRMLNKVRLRFFYNIYFWCFVLLGRLVVQVEKRYTAEQLLKHPFIQTACPEAEFAAYVKKMLAKKRR